MGYVITNGRNYIKTGGDNRPTTTGRIDEARIFDSLTKAQNFCYCLPSTLKKFGFGVEPTKYGEKVQPVEVQPKIEPCLVVENEDTYVVEFDEKAIDAEYIATEIQRFEDFVLFLKSQEPLIKQQQEHAEAQIFDIEHAAEFSKLNVLQGFRLYKLLHDARVMRRKCKDAVDMISYIDDVITEGILTKRTSRRIAGLTNRCFTPRAMPTILSDVKK